DGQLDMEKSSNGLELKLRESISHEKSAEIQKGVRNENIPNPFCRQTEEAGHPGFFTDCF
ncbi:hypothetical protein, partial [Mesobacillus sp.]|uniref:hypothetical protein n=1 Tax=Mesobacillus sp. TaxID=2675271 RepID=UPI0039EEE203